MLPPSTLGGEHYVLGLSVCPSVRLLPVRPLTPILRDVISFQLLVGISMKLDTSPFEWASPKRLLRSQGQRSRSHSDARGNLVNSIAGEPMKGFVPELTQILTTLGRRTDCVFKVIGSKVKVTFAGGGIEMDGSPSKTILTILFFHSVCSAISRDKMSLLVLLWRFTHYTYTTEPVCFTYSIHDPVYRA